MAQGDFASWLDTELQQRGWSQRELARRAGIAQTTVSQVISKQREPTFEFCVHVAHVLGRSPVSVLRQAGLLSPIDESSRAKLEAAVEILVSLPNHEVRDLMVALVCAIAEYGREQCSVRK